jgi:hypothetical protein
MSQENVKLVRRWFELWTDCDWKDYEAIHDPHVVVIPPDDWPDGEVSIGRDAWTRQSIRLKDSWQTDRNELDEVGKPPATSWLVRAGSLPARTAA